MKPNEAIYYNALTTKVLSELDPYTIKYIIELYQYIKAVGKARKYWKRRYTFAIKHIKFKVHLPNIFLLNRIQYKSSDVRFLDLRYMSFICALAYNKQHEWLYIYIDGQQYTFLTENIGIVYEFCKANIRNKKYVCEYNKVNNIYETINLEKYVRCSLKIPNI